MASARNASQRAYSDDSDDSSDEGAYVPSARASESGSVEGNTSRRGSKDSTVAPAPAPAPATTGGGRNKGAQDAEFERLFASMGNMTASASAGRPGSSRPGLTAGRSFSGLPPFPSPAAAAGASPASPDSPEAPAPARGSSSAGIAATGTRAASSTSSRPAPTQPAVARSLDESFSVDDILGETEAALRPAPAPAPAGAGGSAAQQQKAGQGQVQLSQSPSPPFSSAPAQQQQEPAAVAQTGAQAGGLSRYTLANTGSSAAIPSAAALLAQQAKPLPSAGLAIEQSRSGGQTAQAGMGGPRYEEEEEEGEGSAGDESELPMFGLEPAAAARGTNSTAGSSNAPSGSVRSGPSASQGKQVSAPASAHVQGPVSSSPPSHPSLPTPQAGSTGLLPAGSRGPSPSPIPPGPAVFAPAPYSSSFGPPPVLTAPAFLPMTMTGAGSGPVTSAIAVAMIESLQLELATARSAMDKLRHEAQQGMATVHSAAQARLEAMVQAHQAEREGQRVSAENRLREALSAAEAEHAAALRAEKSRVFALQADLAEARRESERQLRKATRIARTEGEEEAYQRYTSELATMKKNHEAELRSYRSRDDVAVDVSDVLQRIHTLSSTMERLHATVAEQAKEVEEKRSSALDTRERLLEKLEQSAKGSAEASGHAGRVEAALSSLSQLATQLRAAQEAETSRLAAESLRLSTWQASISSDADVTRSQLQGEREGVEEARREHHEHVKGTLGEAARIQAAATEAQKQALQEAAQTRALAEAVLSSARAEAEAVRAAVAQSQAEVDKLRAEAGRLQSALQAARTEIEACEQEKRAVASARAALAAESSRVEAAQASVERLTSLVRTEHDRLAQEMKAVQAAAQEAAEVKEQGQKLAREGQTALEKCASLQADVESGRAEVARERAVLSKHRGELRRLLQTAGEVGPKYSIPLEDAQLLGLPHSSGEREVEGSDSVQHLLNVSRSLNATFTAGGHGTGAGAGSMPSSPVQQKASTRYPVRASHGLSADVSSLSLVTAHSLPLPPGGPAGATQMSAGRDELRRRLAAVEAEAIKSTATLLAEQASLLQSVKRRSSITALPPPAPGDEQIGGTGLGMSTVLAGADTSLNGSRVN